LMSRQGELRQRHVAIEALSKSRICLQPLPHRFSAWRSTLQHFQQSRTMSLFIRPHTTPNPEALKFVPGVPVLSDPSKTYNFTNARQAMSVPLAKDLFRIQGIKGVFLGPDFVTVTKELNESWTPLKALIYEVLSEHLGTGKTAEVVAPPSDTSIQPDDSETVQMIKEILETRVRPAVQEDGGDIVYKGFQDGVVLLKMQGACSGCSSSSVTLKQGIERMLMHWIPEVVGVVAVDDDDLEKINLEAFKKTEQQAAGSDVSSKPTS